MIAQHGRVSSGSSGHGVLHGDARLAEYDRPSLGHEDDTEKNSATFADDHCATQGRCWCDISCLPRCSISIKGPPSLKSISIGDHPDLPSANL